MSLSANTNNTTPSSRVWEAKPTLNEKAKKRVRLADQSINNSRCLVENCVESKAVEFCHCFPRSMSYSTTKKNPMMDSIEWHWNMRHRTLNIDTRQNIFRAGASVHYLFDQHRWMLLPDPSIVQRYHNTLNLIGSADRENFLVIADQVFQYRFISISPEMVKIPLIRQSDKDDTATLAKTDITVHLHPYHDLPPLKSHLHPKFVILETGRTLNSLHLKTVENIIKTGRHPDQLRITLRRIAEIYRAWTAALPFRAHDDEDFDYKSNVGDESTQGDNRTDHTAERRVEEPRKRARQDDPNDSPTPAPGRGSGGQHALKRAPSISLSKKSLKLHDEKMGSGGKKWSGGAVQDWSKQCHPLPASVHTPWQPTGICV